MLLLLFLLLTLLFLSLKGLILGQRSRGFSVHSAIHNIAIVQYYTSSSLVIFKTWPAWFLVTRTTCTNGDRVTARVV